MEFLTTREMAGLAGAVGLVSMAHTRPDLERAEKLKDAGVRLFLWESPSLERPASVAARVPSWRRMARRTLNAARAWPDRPVDTLDLDPAFRNLSAPLVQALAERPWQVVSVVQSSSAAFLDYFPRPARFDPRPARHPLGALRTAGPAASGLLERWRWRRAARRYRSFEQRYCNRYDLVATVSEHDAEWVRREYGARRVVAVPLPVDADYFAPQPEREVAGRIVFTGMLDHPPNVDAAVFFARDVFPAVRARVPNAEFHVVGRRPPPEVRALAALEGVYVTADVDDIRPALASGSVFVVPLRYGAGARQKILEAWCMERCVVSTPVGAEGLEFVDGANIAIADGAEPLADATVRALQDPAWRDGLRRGGRSCRETLHDPRRVAEGYWSEIQRVVAEKAGADEPMRVALDFRWMVPGRAGGIENLARSFFRELLAVRPPQPLHDPDPGQVPRRLRPAAPFELPDAQPGSAALSWPARGLARVPRGQAAPPDRRLEDERGPESSLGPVARRRDRLLGAGLHSSRPPLAAPRSRGAGHPARVPCRSSSREAPSRSAGASTATPSAGPITSARSRSSHGRP